MSLLDRFLKKATGAEQRAQYRRVLSGAEALGVKVIRSDGYPVVGTLVDVSSGGAAIDLDPEIGVDLQVGEQRKIVFSTLRQSAITVDAIVRQVGTEEGTYRFGFQFLDPTQLIDQFEEGMLKSFNRRRHRRAKPGLGEVLKADLSIGSICLQIRIDDVSLCGARFHVPADAAGQLYEGAEGELVIHLPKSDYRLVHHAIVRRMTLTTSSAVVGVETELIDAGGGKRGLKRAREAFGAYIGKRLDEMDRYNSAMR